MKLYFVAGEASGDNHGAALMAALRGLRPDLEFSGRGGPKMKALADASFVDWSAESGVVGLWEVVKHYGYFRREFAKTLDDISRIQPDATVLIDYPGFNLRLARSLHEKSLGGKIIYYISPQVWAWNRRRIPQMARWLDLMLCIFPFEAELYEKSGLRTVFVGHPMIDNLAPSRKEAERESNLVGLFPGSRRREVDQLFPIYRQVVRLLRAQRPELRFEVAAASERLAEIMRAELERDSLGEIAVVVGRAAETMQRSAVGIVASGSATLEAAFFRLPFVLVYKVAPLTYLAGRMLIAVKYLGMPNVLANRPIIPEFIQHEAQPAALAADLMDLLNNRDRRDRMVGELDAVVAQLGSGGASEAAARAISAAIQ